ncbi:MAG: DNA polymerase I [Leptolyngbya sp. SIO3F4]|nr:DNA polymerase I [Leptolyngbya sp. SIO3F4]
MGNAAEIWGVEEVCAKFAIERPEQVIDILGLWGDAVDNIPGVPGVGEKTAKKLIGQFGSMEGLYENLDSQKGKLKENLESFREQAFLSKTLATILTDAPVPFEPDTLILEEPDPEVLREVFHELEFRRIAERVLGERSAASEGEQMDLFTTDAATPEVGSTLKTLETTSHDYHLCDSPEKRAKLVEALQTAEGFCFDTETTSLNVYEAELVGLAFSIRPSEAYYVPVPADQEEAAKIASEFQAVLEDPTKEKIGHNLKYDLHVLLNYGIQVAPPLFDTMVAHYILESDNNRRSMDALAETLLKYRPVSITELIGKKGKGQKSMRDIPVDQVVSYAGEDADITLRLHHHFRKALADREETLFRTLEMPLVSVLTEMEHEGVRLDTDMLAAYSEELGHETKKIQQKIYESVGGEFNIASPKQVGEILFDRLKVTDKPKKTKTGQYATSEDILQGLANKHPVVKMILEYREVVKLKNTYVDPLPGLINPNTGRIHTTFNQVVAATGRLSSDNPNLQNIPIRTERGRYIRKAFVPRNEDFVLLSADYSQVELRIIAALSGDEGMREAFRKGVDIHASTASKVYGVSLEEVTREMRSNAKAVNFGIAYGQGAFGLAQNLNISRGEAKEIIDSYFEQYGSIKAYMDDRIEFAREHGYVETILGRKRYLRNIKSANAAVRKHDERNAINSPIQGSAADLIKKAMIDVQTALKQTDLKSRMLLQVHDELVFDVHRSEIEEVQALVVDKMTHAMELEIPLVVDANTGANWLEAH